MAESGITRESLEKALTKRAKAHGGLDAIKKDAIEQYLKAHDRMEDAMLRRNEAASNDSILTCEMNIGAVMKQMEACLSIIGETPAGKRREDFEAEIRDQLDQRGLRGPVFDEGISRVLSLWDAFQEANRSLRERGRSYITISSSGKEYEKDNSATRDIVTLARAVQDALNDLGVSAREYVGVDEDDEL